MKLLILFIFSLNYCFSYSKSKYSKFLKHPNSVMKTIDYSKSGNNWHGICKSGLKQSPISLNKFNKVEQEILSLKYENSEGELKWNGSFFRINFKDEKSKVIFRDPNNKTKKETEYVLKKLIFRTPPEHKVEDREESLEMQLVHESKEKDIKNNILIISIFGHLTKKEKYADDWWKNIQINKISKIEGLDKRIYSLKNYLFYQGSQTVPDCSENVNWIVFKKSINIDIHLLNSLKRQLNEDQFPLGNSRQLQSGNNIEVTQYEISQNEK